MGERRIGVAVGDDEVRLAQPLTTLEAQGTEQDYQAIADLTRQERAGRVVVGLPLSLDGRLGPQARRVQRFVRALKNVCPVPVATWDERLTSVEADRRMREVGLVSPRERGRRDAVAAALLLQAYLDSRARFGQ